MMNSTSTMKEILFKVYMTVCGAVFSGVMFFLTLGLCGGGHGTYLIDRMVGSPQENFYFAWPILFLAATFKSKWFRIPVRCISVLQILSSIFEIIYYEDIRKDISIMFGSSIGFWMAGGVTAYIIVHIWLWLMTTSSRATA